MQTAPSGITPVPLQATRTNFKQSLQVGGHTDIFLDTGHTDIFLPPCSLDTASSPVWALPLSLPPPPQLLLPPPGQPRPSLLLLRE